MKRDELVELAGASVSAGGYTFHTSEEHSINGAVRVWPAAWLAPPVLRSRTGRREGDMTWRITLHLMTLSAGGSAAEAAWQTLERDAHRIVARIASSSSVCAVGNVQCTPARQSLTVHGESSICLVCDVTMWYYE